MGNGIIIKGSYKQYFPKNKSLFVYERKLGKKSYVVICNFKEKIVHLNAIDLAARGAELVLANYKDAPKSFTDGQTLRPYEARVYFKTDS